MRVLNDNEGLIDGKVHLTKNDVNLINSALFYLQHEEPNPEARDKIAVLREQFQSIIKELGGNDC